jgi:predicted enzyme related to lactoylglutathione lyase
MHKFASTCKSTTGSNALKLSSAHLPNNSAQALIRGFAMAQAKNRGRFVWQELMTDDTAAASAFYTRLLGWHAKGSGGDPAYTEFHAGPTPVGGMMKTPDSAKAMGARSMWMPYIGVDQVDSSVKEIEGLGGKVVRPANDIPNVGRFAVLSDPQGAVFAVFTSNTPPMASSGPPRPGEFSWNELATTDHEAALSFYSKAFGWEALFRHDMGPMGTYLIFGAAGVQYGGMFKMSPQHGPHPFWLPYAAVADADASAKLVTASGGRIVNGPMDVPGEGRIAQLTDPGGVLFAIHSQKTQALPAAKPVTPPAAATVQPKPAPPPAPKPAAAPPPAPKPTAAPPPPPAPKPTVPPPPPPKAAPPAPRPAAPPAVKPAAVTTPPTLKPVAPAAPPKAAAAAAPKPAASKKAPAKKKPAAKKKAKPAAKKGAARPKSKGSAKKTAPKARKGGSKKSRKDKSKKDKKKDNKKNRKKDKKARRKK